MNILNNEKVNNMICGIFNNKSYNGFSSKVLKSGICKYTRRGVFDKLEYCIVEMAIFGLRSKSLFTNLINRLKILIMEEFTISNGILLVELINKIEEIEKLEGWSDKLECLLEFCFIVSKCKRGRICSYMNNFYRFYNIEYDNEVKLDKVLKYKRSKDKDDLLKLGELLIESIEENNELIIDIFNKMYKLEGIFGKRYRRCDGVYLFWEIIEDKFKDNSKFMSIFNFALKIFFKKTLKERPYFGVWICIFILNYNKIDWEYNYNNDYNKIDINSYFEDRKNIEIDDYVVKDYHVNKKYSLDKFANEGAYVVDECLDDLGENGIKYKEFYIEKKLESTNQTKKKVIRKSKRKDKKLEDNLEMIDWNNFELIKVIEEGVCSSKLPCIHIRYNDNEYILKEFSKSLNYGRDYILLDKVKSIFDITDLNMIRIKSNKGIVRLNNKTKNYKNNWKIDDKNCIYCMMKYYENIGDLSKNKILLKNDDVFNDSLKIRLFDGLFRSSDNILRNILVDKDNNVISIDEGDIFGKRKNIFNKRGDYSIKMIDINKLNFVLNNIIDKKEEKKEKIIELMKEYGFSDMINEFVNRFDNYEFIVTKEVEQLI